MKKYIGFLLAYAVVLLVCMIMAHFFEQPVEHMEGSLALILALASRWGWE